MFDIPEQYKLNKRLNKDNFSSSLQGADAKRFRDIVKSIFLVAQISGESIPSRVNDRYNAQVIMFVKATVDDIKSASFVANVLQKNIKAYMVAVVQDADGETRLSLATKRLSEIDKNNVVIEQETLSERYNEGFDSYFCGVIANYATFNKILNRKDKVTFYNELITKVFIASNPKLFNGITLFLDSKIWFNDCIVFELLPKMKRVDLLKKQVAKEVDIAERARINGDIKRLIEEIKGYG